MKAKRCLAALALLAAAPLNAQAGAASGIPSAQDAPVAMLVDISSGQVLHERSPNRRFVPASITKVMTLFLAFELIKAGELDPNQTITVTTDIADEWQGKGSTMFLEAGAKVRLSDMLTGIANVSANDAAAMLAATQAGSEEQWTKAMTQKARAIGMTNSHFATPNGWPDGGQTFTTASDLVQLAQALINNHPAKYRTYIGRKTFTYNEISQTNYDPLIERVAGADGIKTGFTNEAGYNYLGSAQRGDQRLVLVIAGARSVADRARIARAYMEWGFAGFDRKRLYNKGAVIGEARVQGGASRQVDLVSDRDVFINLPGGGGANTDAPAAVKVHYLGPLRAPIKAGEEVGFLEISIPGIEQARVPLLAKTDVDEAGFFTRIFNGILGWLA